MPAAIKLHLPVSIIGSTLSCLLFAHLSQGMLQEEITELDQLISLCCAGLARQWAE